MSQVSYHVVRRETVGWDPCGRNEYDYHTRVVAPGALASEVARGGDIVRIERVVVFISTAEAIAHAAEDDARMVSP